MPTDIKHYAPRHQLRCRGVFRYYNFPMSPRCQTYTLHYSILQKRLLNHSSNTGSVMCMLLPSDSINSFSIREDLSLTMFEALPRAILIWCKNIENKDDIMMFCVLLSCVFSSAFLLIQLQLPLQMFDSFKLLFWS